jgi:Mrp family chromosome partitioning ATPase
LDILRRKFACVLIDSPAAMTYGDAELLAQLCDATILVIRGYKTPMAAAYRVAGQLQVVRAKVLGVVLTNVNPYSVDMLEYH